MSDGQQRRRQAEARRRREADWHRELQDVERDHEAGSSQNAMVGRDDVDIFGAPIGEVDECNADPQDSWPQRDG